MLRNVLRRTVFALCGLSLLAATSDISAQSLWKRRDNKKAFMFYDTQAREVGDLITIVVRETTDVANKDSRQMDRNVTSSGGFGLGGAASGDFGTKAGDLNFDTSTNGQGNFDGASAYDVEREFLDRITVCVVDRLPNGNLVLQGRRTRVVSGEQRTLVVSGVVRPIDISADNSVLSQYVGDFLVKYEGDGVDSRFTKQGWATRFWNRLRPY